MKLFYADGHGDTKNAAKVRFGSFINVDEALTRIADPNWWCKPSKSQLWNQFLCMSVSEVNDISASNANVPRKTGLLPIERPAQCRSNQQLRRNSYNHSCTWNPLPSHEHAYMYKSKHTFNVWKLVNCLRAILEMGFNVFNEVKQGQHLHFSGEN